MNDRNTYDAMLIAPCGMNCGICRAFLRKRDKCYGCRGDNRHKSTHCVICKIKNCELLKKTESGFCYECPTYPCIRLKKLDNRYRTKYRMSMLDNLKALKNTGLDKFVLNEHDKWFCRTCGGTICVHTGYCLKCHKA